MGISETEAVNEAIAMSLSEFQDIDESERVNDDELLQTPTDAAMQNAVIAHVGKVLTRGRGRSIIGGAHIHIFVLCIINFF